MLAVAREASTSVRARSSQESLGLNAHRGDELEQLLGEDDMPVNRKDKPECQPKDVPGPRRRSCSLRGRDRPPPWVSSRAWPSPRCSLPLSSSASQTHLYSNSSSSSKKVKVKERSRSAEGLEASSRTRTHTCRCRRSWRRRGRTGRSAPAGHATPGGGASDILVGELLVAEVFGGHVAFFFFFCAAKRRM